MARLFISYARLDGKTFVDRLCAELGGHDAWLDRAELAGGEDWVRGIKQAIDDSDIFLAILTNAYDSAPFAPVELARATRIGKPRIPLRTSAEADVPLFLERIQQIDFSNPAAHQASMRELLDRIAEIMGQTGPEEHVPAIAAQWESIRGRAERQTRRVVTPAMFDPALYVRRESAETELSRFLESPASALIVIGDSGVGKTSLLCHWALDLLDQGHAVLTYDCSTLADTDIEAGIARDLSIAPGAVAELDEEAARAGRSVVIFFDSINDYRGSESNGTQVLIRRIHALVSRLGGRNVRVVASCNAATWDRLRRLAPIRFDREHFHHCGDDPFLRLTTFTDAERDDAYTRYRQVFDLHSGVEALPPAVRERLRDPVLLRMVAEAYRGAKQPLQAGNLGLAIYRRRYFEDHVSLPRASWLVHELADQMLRRQTSALPMMDLARHEHLGPEILSENPSSTYSQLLEGGVLQEVRGDVRAGIVVKFSHTRVAAYALAVNLLERPNVAETVAELIRTAAEFPLGWDVARTLLQLSRDEPAFLALAGSSNLEQRLLAAEALVEWYSEDAAAAGRLLRKLLDQPSETMRRTALRAAYSIGPEARDFFFHAAIEGEASMRETVKNTLYLIWRQESSAARRSGNDPLFPRSRHAPGFTYDFLNGLLAEIRITNLTHFLAVLDLVLDLTVTIYVNHCDEPDVLDKTSEVIHDLCVNRLHLRRIKPGSLVEKLIVRSVTRVLGQQMLNWMLFADEASAPAFFRMPAEHRALLGRIADDFDPATNLATAYADLLALYREEMPIFNGTAATVLAIHACHDFRGTEPLVRRLWDELGSRERRWLLISFGVLVRDTPAEWVPLLEDLTRRYVNEQREDFLHPPPLLARHLDTILMPLGLAYGKLGSRPVLFEQLLRDAMEAGDTPMASRCITALAPAGFYYPHVLFDVLRPSFARLHDPAIATALRTTLATVRTLQFDAVDQFLSSVDAPEPFRHRVDAASDVTLVHRYIRVLGFYNSGVYLSIHYPRMRRTITAGSLRLMAAAQSPVQFVADYTLSVLHMLRDADFRMKNWTLPG